MPPRSWALSPPCIPSCRLAKISVSLTFPFPRWQSSPAEKLAKQQKAVMFAQPGQNKVSAAVS